MKDVKILAPSLLSKKDLSIVAINKFILIRVQSSKPDKSKSLFADTKIQESMR